MSISKDNTLISEEEITEMKDIVKDLVKKSVQEKIDMELIINQQEITKKYDDALRKSFTEFEKEIKKTRGDILKLHGLVANDSVAGGYKKSADDAKRAYIIWSLTSIFFYILALAWVAASSISDFTLFGFSIPIKIDNTWMGITKAAAFTGVALIVAKFAANQSKAHRVQGDHMRWFALETQAVNPFIESIPEPSRQQLRQQFAEKLFGQDRTNTNERPKTLSGALFDVILARLLSRLDKEEDKKQG